MRVSRLFHRARKLARIVTVPAWRRALRHGVAASVEHARAPLPPDIATVLDVGANRGQFALLARARWPSARVMCFEPLPEAAAQLERVFAGDGMVRCEEVALSDADGARTLHVTAADDSSSLLAPTERQVTVFPGTHEIATRTVSTARLDELLTAAELTSPVLLKIDVQGAELDVLRGATGILDSVDAIMVECSWEELYAGQALADDVIAFLHDQGFHMSALASVSTGPTGAVLQGDIVFRRAD